ncbi:LCP family protein [Glutamicibacter sp. MNS18]|uniref:LCP family protein n=1 Tax=Glutamicibacter sp. MNS18 TaxID=2989817 RepID=UPI0022355C7B|nr:LCP family protein [Glutamicibacter sp. MNS18]MCW4466200.1 LCP family protein [Glutamicibacter sp. MNS18]
MSTDRQREPSEFTSRSARYGAQRRRKRRIQAVILSAVAVVLVAALGAGYYVFSLTNKFNTQSKTVSLAMTPEQERARPVKDPDDGSMNILLLGVDHSDEADQGADSLTEAAGQRSDSMMLVHIPEARDEVFIMSIVRDTWIEIPGYGMNKLNAAVALGGVPLLMQTIEGTFDTKIDHVAMIDFEGFRELSTALGGVEVDNDFAFTAHGTEYFYPQGRIVLEGDRALRFVRERKSFTDGDYQRVRNQRKFIAAAVDQLLAPGTLTNPAKVYSLVDTVSPYLTFDESLDAATIVGLGMQLKNVSAENLVMFTMPTAGSATSADGQSIELASELAVAQIGSALQNDTMADYLEQNPPPD